MKRFSAREFALLCVPVAVVAGVGWWASRRPTPKPSYVGPQLQLRVEKPTTLQAFDAVQQVLNISIGEDSKGEQFSAFGQPKWWLRVKTPQGAETWYSSGTGTFSAASVSMASANRQKYSILIKQVPQGALTAGFSGPVVNASLTTGPLKPILLKGQWNVSKSKFKPFDFNLPRASLVKLTSATISTVSATQLAARFTFALQGMAMNEKTTLDNQFGETHGLSNGYSMSGSGNAPKTRVCECAIRNPSQTGVGSAPVTIELSGRVSADNRWPLAFSIEPFDFKTAKVGQQLKFKSWPAPLPPDVPLKH